MCRFKDANNNYRFLISSDGYMIIGMIKNGIKSGLSSAKMQTSKAILQGAATNKIRAECTGNTLNLIVNGEQLASVTEPSFSEGDAGLIAGSYETPGVDIVFKNFSATQR